MGAQWRFKTTTLSHDRTELKKLDQSWVRLPQRKRLFALTVFSKSFDAVVIASGHYHVCRVPDIPGLAEWKRRWPSRVQHSKTYRRPSQFKGQVWTRFFWGSQFRSDSVWRVECSAYWSGNLIDWYRPRAWFRSQHNIPDIAGRKFRFAAYSSSRERYPRKWHRMFRDATTRRLREWSRLRPLGPDPLSGHLEGQACSFRYPSRHRMHRLSPVAAIPLRLPQRRHPRESSVRHGSGDWRYPTP